MIKNHIRIFAFLSFFNITTITQAEITHIIIDPKTLFPTDESLASNYIGKAGGALYVIEKLSIPDQKAFFSALKRIKGISTLKTYDDNLTMPSVLCDWLLSIKTNAVLKTEILSKIKESPMQKGEKSVFSDIVEMMLTPTKLINTKYLNADLFEVLKNLSNKNVTIILAGNYDLESLAELEKKFAHVFNFIDHVIISGEIKELKPSKEFYQYILDTFHIEAKECISFETEQKFIDQAKALGFHVIVQNDKTDKKYFKQQLKTNGIEITV